MTSIELAIDRVKSDPIHDGSGLVCKFYKVGDVGAKVYTTKYHADMNRNAQLTLFKAGFAPKVLSDVIKFDNIHHTSYMFLTEVVITVKSIVESEEVHQTDKDNNRQSYLFNFQDSHRFRHFRKLMRSMNLAGYDDNDEHYGNYGYLPSGKPVVIDCEFACGC